MNSKSKIYIAGHTGLVGSAIIRELKKNGFQKIQILFTKLMKGEKLALHLGPTMKLNSVIGHGVGS